MPKLIHRVPTYRLHLASGQAVVTLDGRDVYLGPFGSRESREAYDRQLAEWLAHSRWQPAANQPNGVSDLTIDELFLQFWAHAEKYYVKNGHRLRALCVGHGQDHLGPAEPGTKAGGGCGRCAAAVKDRQAIHSPAQAHGHA